MKQKNLVSRLSLLIFFSLIFFQVAVNNREKTPSRFSTPAAINSAQLTQVSQIKINNNSDWGGLSSYPWFQGNGTFLDPYIISNISINIPIQYPGEIFCMAISNSSVYFIIQNCKFVLNCYSSYFFYTAGIYLEDVENGIIYNNEFNNNFEASSIKLLNCNNVSLINNNAYGASTGFAILSSYNTNTSGNSITDCLFAIYLNNCDNSSFCNNEIRLTENHPNYGYDSHYIGFSLSYSDFNNISENHFYCISIPLEVYGSLGNIIENNYFHTCIIYNPEIVLNAVLLTSIISMVGIIIFLSVIARKYPQRGIMGGRISIILTIGIMGLLAYGVYNWSLVTHFYKRIAYTVSLIPLFGVNLTILILSLLLIRKHSSRSQSN